MCLYAGLFVFTLMSYPIYLWIWIPKKAEGRNKRIEKSLFWANLIAVIGCAIKLLSYINYNDNGIFLFFCLGQILVSVAIAIVFTTSLLVSKYMFRDSYALIDAFGTIAIGLTLATILVHAVFIDSDKFFTKVGACQFKLLMIMVA